MKNRACIKLRTLFLSFALCLLHRAETAAQPTSDYSFLVSKIAQEYPGFREKIKGMDFSKFAAQVMQKNATDSFRAFSEIVNFFGDRHLLLVQRQRMVPRDSLSCAAQLRNITNYLAQQNIPKSPREGYWINDYRNCIIGIRAFGNDSLVAYAIEARDTSALRPGQIVAKMQRIGKDDYQTEYTIVSQGSRFYLKSHFRNDSVFTTSSEGKWRKIPAPISLSSLPEHSWMPSGKLLDSQTYLLTIPICLGEYLPFYDSLLAAEAPVIRRTKNLIIDLRNNLGGRSIYIRSLIPFIYTNPVKRVQSELYTTRRNVAAYREGLRQYEADTTPPNARDPDWVERMRWARRVLKSSKTHPAPFALIDAQILKADSVSTFPQNVGVLMNYACQSASEMLLLMLQQSRKVTLFGEESRGVVDYLDEDWILLPSENYYLSMPTVRRYLGNDGNKLDNIGIQPQVPISDTVKDWPGFVQSYYQNR